MIVQNGRRKLHYLFPDKTELVEELDEKSNEVLLRKWKRPRDNGLPTANAKAGDWEYEIGDDGKAFNPETDLLAESDKNP